MKTAENEITRQWCELAMELISILRMDYAPGQLSETDAPKALKQLRYERSQLRLALAALVKHMETLEELGANLGLSEANDYQPVLEAARKALDRKAAR